MTIRALVLGTVALLLVAGCARHLPASASNPPRDAVFEQSHEPPISPRTYFAAGQLAEAQGRLDQAIDQYNRALAAQPNYPDALYRLGVVHAAVKNYPQAIQTWNKYVAVTKGSAAAYSNLGFCEELAGDYPAAESAYRRGIAADPRSEPCRVNYGLMLARHGRAPEALAQLQTVLPPAQAHYDLASVYEMLGNKVLARDEYKTALELDPAMQDAKAKVALLGN